jgi:hypothetical protein
MTELTGPEYFAYAYRMSAYSGVMAARAAQYEERERERVQESSNLTTILKHGEHVEV